MADRTRVDTSDAMLALHLNDACDPSCAYCTIDRMAAILAESKRAQRSDERQEGSR